MLHSSDGSILHGYSAGQVAEREEYMQFEITNKTICFLFIIGITTYIFMVSVR